MVVHPAPGNYTGTLVNALLYHCKDSLSGINGVLRPGIVHRIDKNTSGLLIVAKNDFAHNRLAEQIKEHSFKREYQAIVYGNVKENGTVDAPIGRSKKDRKKMCITYENSKNAVTHYEVIQSYGNFTHIKCILETGRTHQIRVHMASIGLIDRKVKFCDDGTIHPWLSNIVPEHPSFVARKKPNNDSNGN